jgi:protoporphyrinogen oxidase
MITKPKSVAVIGAGPAGLTTAYKLQLGGVQVTLHEASNSVGGMAKSFELWNQIVDLGPHRFFSSDPRVNEFWLESLDSEYVMVKRLTRIYYNNRFFSYPIQAFNALKGLGIVEAIRCVISYVIVKIMPRKDETKFDSWVINRFGTRLFQIFFKSYTEKLWGIKCSVLDADFAAQRIKKLSLFEAIKGAIVGNKGNKHRTLVDEFAYPKFGAGDVYTRMSRKFIAAGGILNLNSRVTEIELLDDQVAISANEDTPQLFDHVISTMPLTQLVQKIGAPSDVLEKAKQLKFRNTILVYLKVEGKNPFPDQWIYVHAKDLQTGRITNFRNWTATINKDQSSNIICLEYWCYDADEIWVRDDQKLIELATRELYETKLVDAGCIHDGFVQRVPKCYPVYSSGYREILEPLQNYLKSIKTVTPIGRYGSFKYNNQDHSILMGLLASENLLGNIQTDLWSINTDYEYQESTRITATGLIRSD